MEIITFGGAIQLNALFTAMAAFTSTDDFLSAIRLMLLIASLVIAMEITFTGSFKPAPRLLIAVFIVYAALFARADVEIIDRVTPANSSTVDDVPAGVAVVAHFASVTSDWFTQIFETSFAQPNEMQYRNNGLLFANRLVQASTELEWGDQRYARNMSEFMRSCVYYGANAGWFDWNELMVSTNVWDYIVTEGVGAAIFTSYDAGTGPALVPCTNALQNLNDGRADAIDSTADVWGTRIFGDTDVAGSNAQLLAMLPIAYDYLGTISATGAEIVAQNVMLNSMRRSFMTMAADADATAAIQDFAQGAAEAQARQTYTTLGALAARTLPLIRSILEMLIYGLFPIMFLMVLVTMFPGKFSIFYIKTLIWIHLWPPLYAILHFVMSVYSANAVSAVATIPASVGGGGAGLAVVTQGGLAAVNADMANLAGYLAWTIPLLSWGIMSAGGFAISTLASSLGSVAQSAGSSQAQAAATGQINLGNMRLLNSTSFMQNNAPQMNMGVGSYTDPTTGVKTTTMQDGGQIISTPQQSTGLGTGISQGIQSSVSERASSSLRAAQDNAMQFAQSSAANYDNAMSFRQDSSTGLASTDSAGYTFSGSVGEKANTLNSGLEQISRDHGITVEDALKASIAASAGFDIPLTSFGIKGEVARSGSAANRALMQDIARFSNESKFDESWGQVLDASERLATERSSRTGDTDSNSISASLQGAVQSRDTAGASISEARSWEAAEQRLESSGFSANFDAGAAVRANMIGSQKGIATPGNNSATWTSSEVNSLFAAADRGDSEAIGIILGEAQRFGAQQGLELAGVSDGVGGSGGVSSFYSDSAAGVGGTGAVESYFESSSRGVLYGDDRVDSDLPGNRWNVKTDEIQIRNSVDTITKSAGQGVQSNRDTIQSDTDAAAAENQAWKEADPAGAADDWIPGVGRDR